MNRMLLTALMSALLIAPSLWAAPPSASSTLRDADTVLEELSKIPAKGIPPALLADAQGVAIIAARLAPVVARVLAATR